MTIKEKYKSLQKMLRGYGKVIVAYSGGVDSTFLLKTAVDTLGSENVLACISTGVSEPKHVLERAERIAKEFGVRLVRIGAEELDDPKFVANKADRCFHCKSRLFGLLKEIAEKESYPYVLCGSNFDDKDDYRPGNRAAEVFEVETPMMEVGLTKDEIRELSREMNLATADLPASPCLASRVSYGLEITEQRLGQIEKAEDYLRGLGLVEFRVRHHDTIARIEVRQEDVAKVTAEPVRGEIVKKFKSLGFKFVTVDLEGFRSGSLNEELSQAEKEKNVS